MKVYVLSSCYFHDNHELNEVMGVYSSVVEAMDAVVKHRLNNPDFVNYKLNFFCDCYEVGADADMCNYGDDEFEELYTKYKASIQKSRPVKESETI